MQNPRYALVAYVKGPVGEFVESLRRELHPDLPHFAAHLTLLPPRPLRGTEKAALQVLAAICGRTEPFEVTLGGMDSFAPTTPTVYIRVAYGAMQMCELHEHLNTQALRVCRRVGLHSASDDCQDAQRSGGGAGLADCGAALGGIYGRPARPAGAVDVCAGGIAELLD